jgi:hypothetical protein
MKTSDFGRKPSGIFSEKNLKIVFEQGALFETGVDWFISGGDFQILWMFDEQVDESALSTDARLERNFFLNAMVFADDHDQFQVFAGTKADLAFEDTFRAAFATGVGVAHIQPPC